MPSFFWLSYLKLFAGSSLVPNQVQDNTAAAFAVVGVAALVLGLLLQGVRVPLIRIYSGYYIMALWHDSSNESLRKAAKAINAVLRWKELREYRRMVKLSGERGPIRDGETQAQFDNRRLHEFWLEQKFPTKGEGSKAEAKVLPTKFGNRIRAWEDYARTRWSLETVAIRPHIEAMLGQQETDLRTSAETDLAFALNSSLLALVIAISLGSDRAIETPASLLFIVPCTAPLFAALAFYEIAVVAAGAWGSTVKAAIDLHRLDLYDKLGVARPTSTAQTHEVGAAINRMLLYGEVLPDAVRVASVSTASTPADPLSWLRACCRRKSS